MMPTLDETKHKLCLVLEDKELAAALVDAGYDTPHRISAASDEKLRELTADLTKVRALFPRRCDGR